MAGSGVSLNHGPSVAFRLHPELNGPISEAGIFKRNRAGNNQADEDKINQVSSYHRQHFTNRRGKSV